MIGILKKIKYGHDWWIISRITFLVLIIIAVGSLGFYSIHESFLDMKDYIDAVDYSRETQVLLQKQFQSWKRAIIQNDNQEIYRKEYHEFSRYSALIQDLLFNLKTICSEFDGVPEKIRLLSVTHSKISYEFTSLLFLVNHSSNASKDIIIGRAAGKDEEILNSIDDIVADIKRISARKISQVNTQYKIILVGVLIILVVFAAVLSTNLARKIITERSILQKNIRAKSADLVEADKIIKLSEEKYRRIFNESKEIIFHLDESWNILSINRAVKEHLKIKPEKLYQRNFIDLIHEDPDNKIFSKELVKSKLDAFSKERVPIKFKADFLMPHLLEPKVMDVRLEYINIEGKREVYGTASLSEEDTVQKFITMERLKFQINNSLMAAEDVTFRTMSLLGKYVEPNRAKLIRMGFREILINAIEHGNLNISFEEKTEATMNNEYMKLINKRQNDRNFRNKKVIVDYSIDRDKIIIRVTDEGAGFNHEKMINVSSTHVNSEMLAHGRGIHLAREIFDVIKYNDKGNQVLLVAYFTK